MPDPMDDAVSMSSQLSNSAVDRRYRNAKPLPYRLRQNTNIYLEDKSFINGFSFLTNVVASGLSAKTPLPAFTPSPSTLALCATLIVHPIYTTRAKTDEDVYASNQALRFLRTVNESIGPIHANLKTAFTFETFAKKRRRLERGSRSPIAPGSGERDVDEEDIDSPYVREKSVFNQVEDFWQVVGWAFNCSIAYRKRWDRWKLWLDIMLDVLVADLEQQHLLGKPEESLVSLYLQGKENRTAWREVMAAILADGSPTNINKFGEVWKNETRERKVKENEVAKELDLDEGKFGDYDAVDDEDEAVGQEEQNQEVDEVVVDEHSEDWGGSESIALRQRFIRLLVWHVQVLPHAFPDPEIFLDITTECLRPLPLPIFSQFISTSLLEPIEQCCLLTNLMLPFLSKQPADLDIFRPEQENFIQHFLPYTANSTRVIDNLKMSLIMEALLMNMWTAGILEPGNALSDAVQEGIIARTAKCRHNKRMKEDKEHQAQLQMSAERINLILVMLEQQDEVMNEPRMSAGLDGTDETPLSTLASDMIAKLVDETESHSELSGIDSDMVDPNDDVTTGFKSVNVDQADESSSSSPVFTPESSPIGLAGGQVSKKTLVKLNTRKSQGGQQSLRGLR